MAVIPMEQKKRNKKKILWVAEYNYPSGFGEVSKNILHRLDLEKYDITVLACNYNGLEPVFPAKFPVYGTKTPYGIGELTQVFDEVKPDILFTLNDGYVMPNYVQTLGKDRLNSCHWCSYIVFDGTPINMKWAEMTKHMDTVIFPTPWQRDEMQKVLPGDYRIIWHGTSIDKYFPIDEKEVRQYRKEMFGEDKENAFVFGMVGRNFQRKRFPELIQAFGKFKHGLGVKLDREPLLAIYTSDDARGEIRLNNVAILGGCKPGDVAIVIPNSKKGLDDSDMNMLYNSFDVNCLISIGEGYGLPTNNAASCGKLTIAMDNSVQPYLAKIFPMCIVPNAAQPTFFPHDMEQNRYLPNIDVLAKHLELIYKKMQDKEFSDKVKAQALETAQQLSWDNIVKEWEELFDGVANVPKKMTVI